MKKALSVLLTAVLLLGLAAPAAFAAPAYAGTDPQQTLKVGEEATLTPAHSCPGPVKDPRRDTFLMYWDVEDTLSAFYVNFRPETYVDTNLLKGIWQADSSTLGNGALTVEAVAAGEVTVYVECQDCGWAWAYPFVIEEAEKPIVDPEPNNLCKILRIWWTDLKWTWDYEIHPFFKFLF